MGAFFTTLSINPFMYIPIHIQYIPIHTYTVTCTAHIVYHGMDGAMYIYPFVVLHYDAGQRNVINK